MLIEDVLWQVLHDEVNILAFEQEEVEEMADQSPVLLIVNQLDELISCYEVLVHVPYL